jgi:threonine synthase
LVAESGRGSAKRDVSGKKVVLVCTGHGLKDPSIITESFQSPKIIPMNYNALISVLGV